MEWWESPPPFLRADSDNPAILRAHSVEEKVVTVHSDATWRGA